MTFVKPPLPAEDFVDADGLWDQRFGPYTKEDMQARDAELLRAVADHAQRMADKRADGSLAQADLMALAEALRKAAEQ